MPCAACLSLFTMKIVHSTCRSSHCSAMAAHKLYRHWVPSCWPHTSEHRYGIGWLWDRDKLITAVAAGPIGCQRTGQSEPFTLVLLRQGCLSHHISCQPFLPTLESFFQPFLPTSLPSTMYADAGIHLLSYGSLPTSPSLLSYSSLAPLL